LLSNLVLDEFDRELERRGHRFARYADDSNIYVRSRRAGERVMKSLTRFIHRSSSSGEPVQKCGGRAVGTEVSGLQLHEPSESPKRRIAPKAVKRFKERVRELTSRTRGISIERMAKELTLYLRGWIGYFGKCETPSVLQSLEEWTRRRLRSVIWKQWKRGRCGSSSCGNGASMLQLAATTAGSAHGPWHLANSKALALALPNAYFDSLGIPRLTVPIIAQPAEPPYTDPYVRWCDRESGRPLTYVYCRGNLSLRRIWRWVQCVSSGELLTWEFACRWKRFHP
jgi:RNA-directed DNA polymerase